MFKILTLDKRYTVYRLPDHWENDARLEPGLQYTRIDETIIHQYFIDNSRKLQLIALLEKGYIGYLLHDGKDWINYIWSSTPNTPPPNHIPKKIFDPRNYWIFFCRTNDTFRNRGFYSYCLKLFCQALIEKYNIEGNRIYIDTELELVAADKAIRKAGFEECGYLSLNRIYLPKLLDIKFGKWHKGTGDIVKF